MEKEQTKDLLELLERALNDGVVEKLTIDRNQAEEELTSLNEGGKPPPS